MGANRTFSVSVQTTKPKSISVRSNISQNEISAKGDASLYYSELAKDWAIGAGLIQGEDYSSKTYAQTAFNYAEQGKIYLDGSIEIYSNVQKAVEENTQTIMSVKDETIAEVETVKLNAINEFATVSENAKDDLGFIKADAITTVETEKINAINSINAQKEEIENLSEQEQNKIIDLGIDTRANVDLSNLSDIGEKHFLNKTQITNCITEIPQRIKVEKTTDSFVLKAGSQAIVPNGFEEDGVTPKFEYATFTKDVLLGSQTANATQFIWYYRPDSETSEHGNIETYYTESGASSTLTTQWRVWYDTANNVVKRTDDGGATWVSGLSLPIMLMTNDGSKWTSVDQVFNGFGYIGQCLWTDKGVKALFADGRNEDGTLKNKEVVTTKIIVNEEAGLVSKVAVFGADGKFGSYGVKNYFEQDTAPVMGSQQHAKWLNTRENLMYQTNDYGATWTLNQIIMLGDLIKEKTGNFTSMSIRKPLRVIDYGELREVKNMLTMPNYPACIYCTGTGWFQVTQDSFVMAYGGDSYKEDFWAQVSPDKSTCYEVGRRWDDTEKNTESTSYTFFVPAGWYFRTTADNAGSSGANIFPLKGVY